MIRSVATSIFHPLNLAKLLHHDAVALDVVQFELDRGGRLGRRQSGASTSPGLLPPGAQQDNAPAALHPLGELGGAVFFLLDRRDGIAEI